ncbi:MAG: crotonase/enoyl-CoA hydratase family protein [bacterium]|nr:crotonase/enoyl-CoA hydratase family protein [bacterium]MCP5067989.1 crotonase/enoyl-CoA hydratase family protein [bacterium]
MADELLRYELDEQVAILRFDDGKANAISPAALDTLNAALDRAEKEARAIALIGRPGRFSAGFDLSVMRQGPEASQALVGAGAELLMRMVESPLPIVAGCSGHALAMGALLLLAADRRVGTEGEFKLGLNEVAIGMTLPQFAIELAEERLSRRHLQRSVAQAEIYDPSGAIDAGYLDLLVPAEKLETASIAEARQLTELHPRAFAETKRKLRGTVTERIRTGLTADLATFVVR